MTRQGPLNLTHEIAVQSGGKLHAIGKTARASSFDNAMTALPAMATTRRDGVVRQCLLVMFHVVLPRPGLLSGCGHSHADDCCRRRCRRPSPQGFGPAGALRAAMAALSASRM